MEIQKIAKAIGTYFFAEALCLFLALTLSAVGGGLLRIISCICTISVLICLYVNFAINRAKEDRHAKLEHTSVRCLILSSAAAIPYLISGTGLLLSRGGILPDSFYRWYKLLDAPFLQLCNLCSADIMASSLSWDETIFLTLCNLLPFAVVWLTYTLAQKGVLPEEWQYQK